MKTELQLAEVARLLFNALGKYATETEKEIARTAFVSFSEQQAKKTREQEKGNHECTGIRDKRGRD